ncbi:hypothetical protein KO566_03355 [Flavobacteriaceae bacterium XHP0103]|nr:hypothetical protein [Marixanthotalea marina]
MTLKIKGTLKLNKPRLLAISFLFLSCNTGNLTMIGDMANSLKEVSAAETIPNSNLIWVIEDAGNQNNLYGLNHNGDIIKDIDISNAKNEDWEDLTSDSEGNIYIGDFGNNNGKRDTFIIYKISNPASKTNSTTAEIIAFTLPKKAAKKDFESFFLFNNHFYLFSKESKKFLVLKVPNQTGIHSAEIVTDFNLSGKDNKITSADISNDGKTVILLNHDKLWKLTDFESDQFFEGTIEALPFGHNSQKEGICFVNNNSALITDEKNGTEGNNIYSFDLN